MDPAARTSAQRSDIFAVLPALAAAVVLGASGSFQSYFRFGTWGALALAVLVFLLALLLALPGRCLAAGGWAPRLALGLAAAFVLWAALSLLWTDSRDLSSLELGRTALYTGLFALAWLGVRSARDSTLLMGLLLTAIGVTAAITLIRLLVHPQPLFYFSRLNAPVGYINGEAAYFLLGFWPALAVAQSRRVHPVLRGAAAGSAVLFVDLAILAQSRGAVLALLVSSLIMLAAMPGRIRRAWPLLWIAAIVAVSLPTLAAVYSRSASFTGSDGAAVMRSAGWAVLAGVVVGAAGWCVVALAERRVAPGAGAGGRRAIAAITVAALACALAGGAFAFSHKVGDPVKWARTQFRDFKSSAPLTAGQDRLLSLAGQRYDLWRVAVDELDTRPLTGIGAGSYRVRYYQLRGQNRDLQQAHGVGFEILSERGLVGIVLFAGLIAVGFAAARRRLRDGEIVGAAAGAVVRGGEVARMGLVGLVTYWLAHSSIDWFWVLPGITGAAFLALGALCGTARAPEPAAAPGRSVTALRIAGAALVVLVLVAVALRYVADGYLKSGREVLGRAPAAAQAAAQRAQDLAPWSVDGRYLAAAAQARQGDYARARAELLEAAGLEPRNFVTFVLLGDLATRAGRRAEARSRYREAHRLNPLDATIAQLAR